MPRIGGVRMVQRIRFATVETIYALFF